MVVRTSSSSPEPRTLWYWPCLALCLLAAHCGSGATIQSAPNFSGATLDHRVLLVLPIAVTDDYGDERTGIVLDHQSREDATKRACDSVTEVRDDVRVVCFDSPDLAKSGPFLKDLMLDYARDSTIAAERWHELKKRTG